MSILDEFEIEKRDGLLLSEPHARWIWEGKKKLIVKSRPYSGKLNQDLYLCGERIYGIIRLVRIEPIENLEEFNRLKPLHLLTEETRRKWAEKDPGWGKWPLYAHYFTFKRFARPLPYKRKVGPRTFISDVELKAEDYEILKLRKPFGHPLGKGYQLKILLSLIPEHEVYVEPFVGAGTLFWAKEPSRVEVINDTDPEIAFIYRFLKSATEEEFEALRKKDWEPRKETFERLKEAKAESDVDRAYRFLYLRRHSYGKMGKTFVTTTPPRLCPKWLKEPEETRRIQERLKSVKILNRDFEEVVREFDSENTFFYFDPPYLESGDPNARETVERLARVCRTLKGKFLLSWAEREERLVRKLFDGFNIRAFRARASLKPDKPIDRIEYIVANYPIKFRAELRKAEGRTRIVFLGTRGFVEESNPLHSKHSSLLLVSRKGSKLLIDWGENHDEKVPESDAILITHAHPDHLFGLKGKKLDRPVFMTEDALQSEDGYEGLEVKRVGRDSEFEFKDFKVRLLPVLHSTKAPCVAAIIEFDGEKICYAPDVLNISEKDRRHLEGCTLYIGDGSSLNPQGIVRYDEKRKEAIGHASMHRQIKWCEDAGIKNVVFTHFGKEVIERGERASLESLVHPEEMRVFFASDGMELEVRDHEIRKAERTWEDMDREYFRRLSNEELLELDRRMHFEAKRGITEPLFNAHVFLWQEMEKRHIEHRISDRLTDETRFWIQEYPSPPPVEKGKITLQEVLDSFSDSVSIPRPDLAIDLVGGVVNRGWVTHHDIDVRVNLDYPDPRVKEAVLAACRDERIREKLHFIWQTEGGIGYSFPLYRQRGYGKVMKAVLEVGKPSQPQKAATGELKNEFWEVEDAWRNFALPRIDRGLIVEPKYDGMAMQVHMKDGKVIGIFTEDQLRNRLEAFPKCAEELPKLVRAKDLILAAEMVEYSEEVRWPENRNFWDRFRQIRREDLVKWIAAKPESLDDSRVAFNVHDLLHQDGEDYTTKGAEERLKKLGETMKNGVHWHVTEYRVAVDRRSFFEATEWARRYPNSEGAMYKTGDSVYKVRYDVAGRNRDVAKLKNLKSIDVLVLDSKLIAGQKDVYRAECYIGPIPEKDLDKYREEDVKVWNGKPYLKIGMSYYIKGKVPKGSIIEVKPVRIEFGKDERGKIFVTWMFPKVGMRRPEKREPDPIDVAEKIARLGTAPMEPLKKDERVIRVPLRPCPFKDDEVCPLRKLIVVVKAEGVRVMREALQFPIRCKLARLYKCFYVKPYYYAYEEVVLWR